MITRRLGLRATRFYTTTRSSRYLTQLGRPEGAVFQSRLSPKLTLPRHAQRQVALPWSWTRYYSSPSDSSTASATPTPANQTSESELPEAERPPSYKLTFTCKPCKHRSTHYITKQGYHYGAVLITCPECKNRHVISDHLGIFADQAFTVEDLMRQKGDLVKKGTLNGDGDIEFWDDGTHSERTQDVETSRDTSKS